MRWLKTKYLEAVACPECGHGSTRIRRCDRDDVSWGAPAQRQYRACPRCEHTFGTFYFLQ